MSKIIEFNTSVENLIHNCNEKNNRNYKISVLVQLISFFLFLSVIFSASYINGAARTFDTISDKILRLHIVANSDSEKDQSLKLKVRDEILKEISYDFEGVKSKEELISKAEENKRKIREIAIRVLRENNCFNDVTVEIGKENFPTKRYEDIVLPRGEYNAIRVLIGEHKGENWWCVAFPSLCFSDSIKNDNKEKMSKVLKEDEIELISSNHLPKMQIKFFIVELIQDIKEIFKN